VAQVSALYRHPIKAVGYERLDRVDLVPDATFPGDRAWAVAHEASDADGSDWAHCSKFIRGAKSPALMAVQIATQGDQMSLSHPAQAPLTVTLPQDAPALIDWLVPLNAPKRALPQRLVQSVKRGMTDAPSTTVSVLSTASMTALSQRAGLPLTKPRFRGNIWVDGLDAWEEEDWVGKTVSLGPCTLEIVERIERCTSLNGNPVTGLPDIDLLSVLEESPGAGCFGVLGRVVTGGPLALGDPVQR